MYSPGANGGLATHCPDYGAHGSDGDLGRLRHLPGRCGRRDPGIAGRYDVPDTHTDTDGYPDPDTVDDCDCVPDADINDEPDADAEHDERSGLRVDRHRA